MKIPERFAGAPVVGVIKVAEDPSVHPNRLVILTHSGRVFNVHQVAWDGTQWVAGQGHYDLSWERALDDLAGRAKAFLPPEPVPLVEGRRLVSSPAFPRERRSRRCEATVKVGGNDQMCDQILDGRGQCDRASDHVEG